MSNTKETESKSPLRNFKKAIIKLNSHTHIKINSQFMRGLLMVLLSFIMIAIISSITEENLQTKNNELKEENIVLENELQEANYQIKVNKDSYKELLVVNNEQQNNIEELEAKVAALEEETYELNHPQKAYNYTSKELEWLAKIIWLEAGSDDCTNEHQCLIAAVVLCRVNSSNWANTIEGVISQDGQYGSYKSWGWYNDVIPQRCYDNALKVLNGEFDYPDRLVYQSSFKQRDWGKNNYEVYKTFYTASTGITTYFCLGD